MYTHKSSRRPEAGQAPRTYAVLSELSRSLFDDAMVICDDEREAAFLASAKLLRLLEKKRREQPPKNDP